MNNTITPEDALQLYIQSLISNGSSHNTIRQYNRFLQDFHIYLQEHIFNGIYDLEDIKREHIEAYACYLQDIQHNCDGTRNNKIACIRTFFSYLTELDYIPHNIASKVHVKITTKVAREALTKTETTKLLTAIDNPLLYAVISTIAYAGLRVSEVTKLSLHDVSLDQRTIHIKNGKNKKERILPISKNLYNILCQYEALALPHRYYYFASEKSGHISQQYIDKALHKYKEEAGIRRKVSAHILRHTFASTLAQHGTPLPVIQQLLGHANIKTTGIYLHAHLEDMKQAVDELYF